jgi:hypothetical protein
MMGVVGRGLLVELLRDARLVSRRLDLDEFREEEWVAIWSTLDVCWVEDVCGI